MYYHRHLHSTCMYMYVHVCMKLELVPGSCTCIYMHIIWSLVAHIGVKIRGCDSQSEGRFMVISSTCVELGHTEWRKNRVAGLVLASSPTSFPAIHTFFFIQCMHRDSLRPLFRYHTTIEMCEKKKNRQERRKREC